MRSPFDDALAALASALQRLGAGWYLFGAQGALLYGRAEDIITMKILAGRSKDLDDVYAILKARGDDLDLDLVRTTLTLLEQAIDQSDLMPAFERALNRSRPVGR